MNDEKIPTLEDWKKYIYEDFIKYRGACIKANGVTDEEVRKYLFEDGYIEHMYEEAKKDYEDGKIPIGVFRIGRPSAIAYDLEMSF